MTTITTTAEYEAALVHISDLIDECAEVGEEDANELQQLIIAIEVYEKSKNKTNAPDEIGVARSEPQLATHVIFYTNICGREKQYTGTLAELRAWAKAELRLGNIIPGWELEKLD